MTVDDIEKYVSVFGEHHRKLIVCSLDWLEENEKIFGLKFDRDDFIHELISRTAMSDCKD